MKRKEGGRDEWVQRLVVNNGETWGEEVAGEILGEIANACYLEEPYTGPFLALHFRPII